MTVTDNLTPEEQQGVLGLFQHITHQKEQEALHRWRTRAQDADLSDPHLQALFRDSLQDLHMLFIEAEASFREDLDRRLENDVEPVIIEGQVVQVNDEEPPPTLPPAGSLPSGNPDDEAFNHD